MTELVLKSILFVFVADTYLYWQHRALHKFAPKIHALHHMFAFRTIFHPLEQITNWAIFPIGWAAGFTTTQMLPVIIWTIMFTFMSHREEKPRRTSKIFMSLRGHERHHDLYDKNYGVMLTLWDRLAGTYE
jgi:Delta7-sterol 5-desaturase